MSTIMDSTLDAERLADCERTDAAMTHKRTLKLGDQQVPIEALNDDDVYVIHLRDRRIVERFGAGIIGQTIRNGSEWPVRLGCALLTGLQAKGVL